MDKRSIASLIPHFQNLMEVEEMWTLFSWWSEESTPRLKLMKKDIFLSEAESEALLSVAKRRAEGLSLTYALGWRPFYGRRFAVTADVLVPRQETEELVDHLLKLAATEEIAPILVDCGTGSGCIPVTLSLEATWSAVHAWDVSKAALAVAQKNATNLGDKQVKFHHGDIRLDAWGNWLEGVLRELAPRQNCLLAGNLPYIPSKAMSSLDIDVQQEPTLALDGGLHGTAIMKPWLLQIHRAATKTATIHRVTAHLEGDPDNVEDLNAWCEEQGFTISWREDALGQLRFCDIAFGPKHHD